MKNQVVLQGEPHYPTGCEPHLHAGAEPFVQTGGAPHYEFKGEPHIGLHEMRMHECECKNETGIITGPVFNSPVYGLLCDRCLGKLKKLEK